MKFSWGTGIALFYGTFVAVLVVVVIRSFSVDHDLVVEDYYKEDLAYQSHYVKLENAQKLTNGLLISLNREQEHVRFQFPVELGANQGVIRFYRPSDKGLDFEVPVQPDANGEQFVPSRDLKPGLWKVQVDWQAGGKPYFKEESIMF